MNIPDCEWIFQITHQVIDMLMMRGINTASQDYFPNPVLTGAVVSQQFMLASNTLQQGFMGLFKQSGRNGQFSSSAMAWLGAVM